MKTYYYNDVANFGDELNVPILRDLFGISLEFAVPKQADFVGIGSNLQKWLAEDNLTRRLSRRFSRPLTIWSSGLVAPALAFCDTPFFERRTNLLAIRGRKTASELAALGVSIPTPVYGDGGLLCGLLLEGRKRQAKRHRFGVVVHYADAGMAQIVASRLGETQCLVIDVQAGVEKFLTMMATCEVVLSSAMHGLIAADSLGIPNAWIALSDRVYGGSFKFEDYYSAFENRELVPLSLDDLNTVTVDRVKERFPVPTTQVERIQGDLSRSLKEAFA